MRKSQKPSAWVVLAGVVLLGQGAGAWKGDVVFKGVVWLIACGVRGAASAIVAVARTAASALGMPSILVAVI